MAPWSAACLRAETDAEGKRLPVVVYAGLPVYRSALAAREAGAALLDAAATTGESLPQRFAAGEPLPAVAVNLGREN